MKLLSKPPYKHDEIFDLCISNIRQANKTLFENAKQVIMDAGDEYKTLISTQRLFTYKAADTINGVISKKKMNKLYTERLSKLGHPARSYYDKIRMIAPQGKCPLCGVRDVKTLDHYLPKGVHPIFAVFPENLVPACTDCNIGKKQHSPKKHVEETLHPYFDDIDAERWLYAEISRTKPAVFTFYVSPPASWHSAMKDRVEMHLNVYQLHSLYSSHAAEELSNINLQLKKIYLAAGAHSVKDHIKDGYESRLQVNKNSWQTAMYEAMYSDGWFHNNCFFT